MNLDQLTQVSSILGSFATVAAALVVPLLLWQTILLRRQLLNNSEQNELTRVTMEATLDGQIFARLDVINGLLAEHPGLYASLFEKYDHDKPLANDQTHLVADMALTLYEHVFNVHSKFRLMEEEVWESWKMSIQQLLVLPYFEGYWTERARENYNPQFRELIDDLLPAALSRYQDGSEHAVNV